MIRPRRSRSETDAGASGTEVDEDPAEDTETDVRTGRRRPRRRAAWWELPVLVVVAVAVAVLVKTFVMQPYIIPSGSMETTLHGCEGCSGDRILDFKPVYSLDRDPHPGDIVVFKDPGGWDVEPLPAPPSNPVVRALWRAGQFVGVVPPSENDLVKRVIAVGGQTVKCCDANGNVQVSDDGPGGPFRSLDDASFTYLSTGQPSLGRQPFGPVTVPVGRLWVMGDHRDGSADSRANCVKAPEATADPDGVPCSDGSAVTAEAGTVPLSNVIGKAVVIAWPPSRWTTLGTPETFEQQSASAGPDWLPPPSALLPLGVGLVAAGGVQRTLRPSRRRSWRLSRQRWRFGRS